MRNFGTALLLVLLSACGRQPNDSSFTTSQQLGGDQRSLAWFVKGDANKDSKVDILDLAQVSAWAKVGTGQSATWEEGDFNGDGIVTSADIELLNVNYGRSAGDANLDGVVDILDSAQISAAAKLGTDQSATWEEGDFNGDGSVTRVDIEMLLNIKE